MPSIIRRFLQEEQGVTAAEYAVMLAFILLACIGAVNFFGTSLNEMFTNSSNQIQQAGTE